MSIFKAILWTILYILLIELVGAWALIPKYQGSSGLFAYYVLVQGALQAGLLVLVVYILLKTPLPTFTGKGIITWYLLALGFGVVFVFIQTPLNWIYNLLFNDNYNIVYQFNDLGFLNDPNLLAIVVLIPLSKEVFFREIVQRRLQKKVSAIVAITVSSILFASIHAPYYNLIFPDQALNFHRSFIAFFGGLISAFLYYRSGSLGPSLLAHFTWNFMVYFT